MAMTNVERESVPRKTTILFFIIDTSGSMAGTRIGAVNSAIEQTLEKLREMNADSADAEIEVALLEFSSGARWLTPNGPMKVENYYWSDLDADGLTDMGEAFRMLEEKLHKSSGFMQRASGSYAPVLFLMSDGEPTDDYKSGLSVLQQNNWYKYAIKVAVAIGDDANTDVLKEFTGNIEAVVTVHTPEALRKMIRFVSITSSQIGSKSQPMQDGQIESKQDSMIDQIKDLQQTDPDLSQTSTSEDDW